MIKGIGFKYEKFNFPVGEMHVRLKDCLPHGYVNIIFNFERNEEVLELLLICDALKRKGIGLEILQMDYVPFGRQDRVAVNGEPLSVSVFAELINSCGFKQVRIIDPHSDVTPALIKNCVITQQHEVFEKYFNGLKDFYLVSPDGGALKKIYKLAEKVECKEVIECSKIRNVKTGEIAGIKVNFNGSLMGIDCFIVDDICDGGRTFIEIAKALQSKGAGKITLMVTHGFFTKGLSVFDGLIDEIFTLKGKIK